MFYTGCMAVLLCWQRFGVQEGAVQSVFIKEKLHHCLQQCKSCSFHLVHRDISEYKAHYLPVSLIYLLRSKTSSFMPKIRFLGIFFSTLRCLDPPLLFRPAYFILIWDLKSCFIFFPSILSFLCVRSLLIFKTFFFS